MEGLGVPTQNGSGVSHPSPTPLLSALYGGAGMLCKGDVEIFLKKGKSSEKHTEGKKKKSRCEASQKRLLG